MERTSKAVLFALVLAAAIPIVAQAEELHWWNGFSFTPGVGARHLGLDVVRKSDGDQGNIAQGLPAKLFAALSIETPSYQLSGNWGISVRSYSSFVTLDHQFYDYHTTSSSTGASTGERIDVGTKITGRYSYLVPLIHYSLPTPTGGMYKVALGYGYWSASFSGDIILTPDGQPVRGMPTDRISFSTKDQLAYLFLMSWRTADNWLFEMAVGGPTFSDANYDYQVEEVSIIVGKTIVL